MLAALATHLALADHRAAAVGHALYATVFVSGCVLALGGCLWFVVARQVSHAAALVALWLFIFSPFAWHPDRSAAAALSVFVTLMTAVGVGHALHGPPRKWPPRFALLAACTAATALLQPWLGWAAVAAAGAALLYLAEARRGWAVSIVLGLAGVASLGICLRSAAIAACPALFALHAANYQPEGWMGIFTAMAAAFALWSVSPRSRFFGHTAPLLAALLFAAWSFVLRQELSSDAWSCAVAPALLFIAGVFADGLAARHRRWWQGLAVAVCAMQAMALFLLTT